MRGLFAAASLASLAVAAPAAVEKRANIDTTVLQFALTLEHLENVFYEGVLKKFSEQDFINAGYSADYYNDLKYIAYDEQQHVIALTNALKQAGAKPVQACTYKFPYTDVPSFITLSSVLEGVGTSAYLGGAPLITNKQYLTVAGSILSVEALHTSLQRAAIGEVPNANPFYSPLEPNSVFTLASMFIVSCPKSNTPLPFKAYPGLAVDGKTCTCEEPECGHPSEYIKREVEHHEGHGHHESHGWGWHGSSGENSCTPPVAGNTVTFTAVKKIPAGSYVTFISGLTVTSVKGAISGSNISAKIPSGIMGQSYVFVTKSDVEGTFDTTQVEFGPAVLEVKPAAPVINYGLQK